jgi:hypothetical protein
MVGCKSHEVSHPETTLEFNAVACVPFGLSASPGSGICLAATTLMNPCSWESAMAMAWALVATATSREEEGKSEHSSLQTLSSVLWRIGFWTPTDVQVPYRKCSICYNLCISSGVLETISGLLVTPVRM